MRYLGISYRLGTVAPQELKNASASCIQIAIKDALTKLIWLEVKGCAKDNCVNHYLLPLAMMIWKYITQQDHKYPNLTEVNISFAMHREHEEIRYSRLQLIQQVFA